MIKLVNEWQEKVRSYYNEHFYIYNDEAHGLPHVDEVWDNLQKILIEKRITLDMDICYLMVYTHDIFAGIDRTNHHTLAYSYIINMKDAILKEFENRTGNIKIVANAVLKHRASSDLKPDNAYEIILRLADRGVPDLNKIILRSMQYHKSQNKSAHQVCEDVKKHIKEKFSRTGYAFNDAIYVSYYKNELNKFWDEVDEYLTHTC